MTVVTLTFDDADGKVAVTCAIPNGFNPDSMACQMVNSIMNFIDSKAKREPQEAQVIHTLDEYRGKRAAMVRDIKPEPVEIFAG